jgi:MFS family permease
MQAGNVREGMRAALLPWVVCLSASLFFFYEFVQGNMFASIADEVMRDFHIKADKMAYLSSSYYILNVLFLFIAGAILDAYSIKRTVILAWLMRIRLK